MPEVDVIVVGGGAIGLAVAWRAAERGLAVSLIERDEVGSGASHVAAGMLSPVGEVEFGGAGADLLALGLESARRWPAFAAELAAASSTGSRLRRDGTLIAAADADQAAALEREVSFRRELGLDIQTLRPSEARRLEPALAPTLRLAAVIADEASVDPRWLADALAVAARRAGTEIREHTPAVRLWREDGAVVGVELGGAERLRARSVVLAAGAWSAALDDVAVRPAKGQIMRLRDRNGPGLVGRVIRFESGYLVPRGDGQYVLGATVEDQGFDVTVTARALYELLRDAADLVPGLLELEIEELRAGLRPATPDNLPLVGPVATEGLLLATGHYRNGILLVPLTADVLAAHLLGDDLTSLAELWSPARLASRVGP